MSVQFTAIGPTGDSTSVYVNKEPHDCPFCHRSITAKRSGAIWTPSQLSVTYQCPDSQCKMVFIGYYTGNGVTNNRGYSYSHSSQGTIKGKEFSDDIKETSQAFVDIYNQSLKAEELGLNHVCGIGYRKALEFLIKDYLISINPEKVDEIKKKLLGECIKKDVANPNLKDMASRAAWLGNDETHYTKKWVDKDIHDLKILIDVTVHWVQMELLTEKYKAAMP